MDTINLDNLTSAQKKQLKKYIEKCNSNNKKKSRSVGKRTFKVVKVVKCTGHSSASACANDPNVVADNSDKKPTWTNRTLNNAVERKVLEELLCLIVSW